MESELISETSVNNSTFTLLIVLEVCSAILELVVDFLLVIRKAVLEYVLETV